VAEGAEGAGGVGDAAGGAAGDAAGGVGEDVVSLPAGVGAAAGAAAGGASRQGGEARHPSAGGTREVFGAQQQCRPCSKCNPNNLLCLKHRRLAHSSPL
jgi:hypothetical protein